MVQIHCVGAVTLSSTSSTRLFFDNDVPETIAFTSWYIFVNTSFLTDSIPKPKTHAYTRLHSPFINCRLHQQSDDIGSSSTAIAKIETVTIKELKDFIQDATPQVIFPLLANIISPNELQYRISVTL